MKQTRRKELKTNVLSVYLEQIYETAADNATYLVGGAIVVVAVLVIGLLIQRNRHQAEMDAWTRYYELESGDVLQDPGLLDRTRLAAAENEDRPGLGNALLQLQADLANRLALSLITPAERDRRVELFKEARDAYEKLIARAGNRQELANAARMSLAAVQESLAVLGEAEAEDARQVYRQLVAGPANPFKEPAQSLMDNLDERLARLQIVASRPAEAPRTRPAPTSVPAEPTTSAAPATLPASTPAS